MNRTVFLVAGFDLYHPVRVASVDLGGQSTKWLDTRRPVVTARHRRYLECLSATGVIPTLSRFKYKTVRCYTCKNDNPHYEEKE